MVRLIVTVALLFVVYIIGYIVGRKEVVDDIKQMTEELRDGKDNIQL